MRFMLVDDDEAIRSMLSEIIEDYDLGKVIAEAENGLDVDNQLLTMKNIDILIIDMLMPLRDGIQTVKNIKDQFNGKIIMLSQVEDKELVGNAYSLGVDYYITKPINRNEVVSVIRSVSEHIRLKTLVHNIESNLHVALRPDQENPLPAAPQPKQSPNVIRHGEIILGELGISGEKGAQDLLDILQFLHSKESTHDFPSLKDIFTNLAASKFHTDDLHDIQKEYKALEQRLRRTIFQAMVNLASLGIVDYANTKFEEYAPKYFDFAEIRKIMRCLEDDQRPNMSQVRINSKKFIKVFFMETKK
jgi:two-component system response regulator YcbB